MIANRLARAALAYADQFGWRVFPLAPKGKLPVIPKSEGGRGCLDATDDLDTIEKWWRRYPMANVGVATGHASGFWVLDVDPRNGGDASYESAVENFGAFPQTVEGLTGGGGRHVLLCCREDQFYGIKWIPVAPGLDCKGTGGYCVFPPSIHPETGREYTWEVSCRPGENEIAQTPEWLERLLLRNVAKRRYQGQAQPSSCDPDAFYVGRLLKSYGWLGEEVKPGVWAARCPGEGMHTCGDRFTSSTVVFAPGPGQSLGFFHCSHEHCRGLYVNPTVLENYVRRIAEREGL